MTEVHPIEAESYRILRSRIDLSALPPLTRAVTERIIHATADFDYVTDLVCDEMALAAGVEALRRDAPVIADVAMVASGITGYPVICRIGDSLCARLARTANITLSAAAVRLAHGEAGPGAVWLVGCAPTALAEIMSRQVEPALVIGVPVGFVGAADAKDSLRASGLPALSNISEKGGSAVAVAAFNALLRIARKQAGGKPRTPRDAASPAETGAAAGRARHPRPRGCGGLRRAGLAGRQIWPAGTARGWRAASSSCPSPRCARPSPAWPPLRSPAAAGAKGRMVAVPLMLSAAGHAKGDIPAALARERARHPGLTWTYGRPLGPHPALLELLAARIAAVTGPSAPAVLLVGRGSTDPDANADVVKTARLLWEGRDYPLAETAFVSLARPDVTEGLERCRLLGARQIVVARYFLFPGVLPDRVAEQAAGYAAAHPGLDIRCADVLGDCDEIAALVYERYQEALSGDIRMNCDVCVYRIAMPGFEHRVGEPQHSP